MDIFTAVPQRDRVDIDGNRYDLGGSVEKPHLKLRGDGVRIQGSSKRWHPNFMAIGIGPHRGSSSNCNCAPS